MAAVEEVGVIRVQLFPPQFWLFGRRVHHGLFGLVLLLHDRKDFRLWIRDFIRHPGVR